MWILFCDYGSSVRSVGIGLTQQARIIHRGGFLLQEGSGSAQVQPRRTKVPQNGGGWLAPPEKVFSSYLLRAGPATAGAQGNGLSGFQ